jgi:DNA-binding Lrp family transcriptional regulator
MDDIDRALLALLQVDAGQAYASLGEQVGLSAGAAHERVRKLRERGVIRRTTVDVDRAAVGRGVVAFVLVEADAWMGDSGPALEAIAGVEEAHVTAGSASILVKVSTTTSRDLQQVLRALHEIDGVTRTEAIIVLETLVERDVDTRNLR